MNWKDFLHYVAVISTWVTICFTMWLPDAAQQGWNVTAAVLWVQVILWRVEHLKAISP